MNFNNTKRLLISAVVFSAIMTGHAFNFNTLPVKSANGKMYHYYTVQQHETVYALSKRFGISEDKLLAMNPGASDGLKTGQEILVAVATENAAKANTSDTYVVKKQETAYGISKRFGIELEDFYNLNPEARNGVKEGQVVIVKNNGRKATAAKKQSTATTGAKGTHVIAEHETLYQIARNYNISLADLLSANPNLDTARYTAGTTITIPQSSGIAPEKSVSTGNTYIVKSGDTFYGIATRHGIDMAQLYAANPGVDILKGGMIINLPQSCAEQSNVALTSTSPSIVLAEPKRITIAVALPFMVEQGEKHNKSMVEMYRGFLLAVDSLRNAGQPIHILTYDTKGSVEGVQQILDSPELKNAQAIIAPDNAEHLNMFNHYGQSNKIAVMNLFNNRDSAYLTNPFAMQMAIPRDDMYTRAAKEFIASFNGFTPVFLVSNDGKRDKVEFIDVMKEQLQKAGKSYKEITYNGTLSLETLNNTLKPNERFAFLPGSSNKEEFERIAAAMQAYKDTRDFKNEVVVWGYPEWLANRGGYKQMHELDCYIYSRNDLPETFTTEAIDNNYLKWYGPIMMSNFPKRSYMGFDAGMYLLKAIMQNGDDLSRSPVFVSGLTLPISMQRKSGGGMVNNSLLMINLAPGEIISKRSI